MSFKPALVKVPKESIQSEIKILLETYEWLIENALKSEAVLTNGHFLRGKASINKILTFLDASTECPSDFTIDPMETTVLTIKDCLKVRLDSISDCVTYGAIQEYRLSMIADLYHAKNYLDRFRYVMGF